MNKAFESLIFSFNRQASRIAQQKARIARLSILVLEQREEIASLSGILCNLRREVQIARELRKENEALRGELTAVPKPAKPAKRYVFRNYPCNIVPGKDLWCVSGVCDGWGAGVLEWCKSEADANHILSEMQRDFRFSYLRAEKYND